MKTVGQILKDARSGKDFSLRYIEKLTKIKTNFIAAIEDERWDDLPPFPTVLGFVKSIAGALSLDEHALVAVLKRDYPPKKLAINPKPDISKKFIWSPKLTFALGTGVVLAVVLGYLAFQYVRFISPPALRVESPASGQIVSGAVVTVFGTTDPDAKVTINNQPVIVDDNGKFSISLGVVPETKEVDVVATSRSGKTTTIRRTIKVE